MERAGFLIRALSYTLDRIVMGIVALAVIFGSGLAGTIFSLIKLRIPDEQIVQELIRQNPMSTYLCFGLYTFLFFLYYSFEIVLGATPVKMFLGLKILSSDGYDPSWISLLVRWILKHVRELYGYLALFNLNNPNTALAISTLIVALIIELGYLMIIGSEKRGLHDRLTNTAVYKI